MRTIEIERESDERWLGEIPELPGVVAYGATEAEARTNTIDVLGTKKLSAGRISVLKGDGPDAVNSLQSPMTISPVEQTLIVKGNKVSVTLPPRSLSVIRIKIQK